MGMKPHAITPPPPAEGSPEHEAWLQEIISLQEAARIRGNVHVDTLKREAARGRITLVRRSVRCLGVRRKDALYPP
jgi:hypothetical protein